MLGTGKVDFMKTCSPDADMPPHKGILREEVLALRNLFGYTDFEDPSITLSTPELGVCLPSSRMKDVLLLSIDVDAPLSYVKSNPEQQLHLGVSILDTRNIQTMAINVAGGVAGREDASSPPDIIQNYQFAIGICSQGWAQRASRRFIFGESELIHRSEIQARLEDLTGGRAFVSVFHGTSLDLTILKDLGIDIPIRGVYVFDTNKVAQWPLQLHYRLSLEKLCLSLGVPFTLGHTAGNDANFALRALLMLAVKDAERLRQIHHCETFGDVLDILQDLATSLNPAPKRKILSNQTSTETKQERDARQREYILQKKAKKQARKQLRREGNMATGGVDGDLETPDVDAKLSELVAEKYASLRQFADLPSAEKRQIWKATREAHLKDRLAREKAAVDAPQGSVGTNSL